MAVDERIKQSERAELVANALLGIQKTILERYPEAAFDVAYGPDDAYNIRVYTNEASLWKPVALVEDELIRIHLEHRIEVHVVPLLLADREPAALPRAIRRDARDNGHT